MTETTPGLRRVSRPDPKATASDADLVARIRAEINRDGPMTFARFMSLALYDPAAGYYRTGAGGPGRQGDFLTAPETHPIFGWALARQIDDLWRVLGEPASFVVREHGAGAGALALATLDGLRRSGSPLLESITWQLVDVDPGRLELAHRRADEAGLADRLAEADERPIVGCVLANELLDALPVHRLVMRGGSLREVLVTWKDGGGGGFVDVEAEPSTPALAERLAAENVDLADGQRAEVCLELDGWIAAAAAGLAGGVVLIVDYGHPAPELYDPRRRRDGTLRAYVGQAVHDDPYRSVGRQDLTAHVDFSAVERAAVAAGLEPLGAVYQAEFLAALEAGELLRGMQDEPNVSLQDYLEARASLGRMVDPAAMGRFRVVAFGRGLRRGTRLRGFATRGLPFRQD